MKEFDIDHQFLKYLQRCELDPRSMSKIQLVETKRAFFGGCSQMLVVFRDEITKLRDQDAVDQMESMFNQCERFWINEMKNEPQSSNED